jgi:predicted RNA-binding protein with PUA-like domain
MLLLIIISFIHSFYQSTLNYWLVKSEPDAYGWHHFIEQGRAVWDGVRNYQARNNLRTMQLGDQVLFYHSNTKPGRSAVAVVGLATVVAEAYPDPAAATEAAKMGTKPTEWVVVELEPVMVLDNPVSLARIKAEPLLANLSLIRQSRLSVMPVRADEFELILKMGQEENYE